VTGMASRREVQVAQAVAEHAADFFARESSVAALITVTRADMSSDLKRATIYISVLPQSKEEEAIKFAKRARSDLHSYIRAHSFLHPTPVVDLEIDYGEKNRQRIDDLTRR